MNKSLDPTILARLSVQRALLGQVPAELRAVVLSIRGRDIEVREYFDGPISEVNAEMASCVETEIIADYDVEDTVTIRCIRLDFPEPIQDDGVWVYFRSEAFGE